MNGPNILGFEKSNIAKKYMYAFDAATQKVLKGAFHKATPEEVDKAMRLATQAFSAYQNTSPQQRATFLRAIADEIISLGDPLIQRAIKESALPEVRLLSERKRTIHQLHAFAEVLLEGSWMQASIDYGNLDRKPNPKPDLRKMHIPIGPVVVFTASNFPFAYSTAGVDTAAALAAGCPVIVKAHEAHLGTNTLVSIAIQRAAHKTNMPDGVFSSLNGTGIELGQMLAQHPLVKAIAFTGSPQAGRALMNTASQRPVPIPVFAEMGSVNPVVILNGALQNRKASIVQQVSQSINASVGQFCTNPGLLIVPDNKLGNSFIKKLGKAMLAVPTHAMLNEKVYAHFVKNRNQLLTHPKVTTEATLRDTVDKHGIPTVASVAATDFIADLNLQQEVFGPFTLIVRYKTKEEVLNIINHLEGQLTGTIIGEMTEIEQNLDFIAALQSKVGRLIFNGVPTGVEVCASMHHGGPYPATSNALFGSVGDDAMQRFLRPISFQDFPTQLLPLALRDDNPLQIRRRINGFWTKK